MILYVSGPMAGYPEHNFPAFNAAAAALRNKGYVVLNPAEHQLAPGLPREDYLRADLKLVLESHGVALLPGWEPSWGANAEVATAHTIAIPCLPLTVWLAQSPT